MTCDIPEHDQLAMRARQKEGGEEWKAESWGADGGVGFFSKPWVMLPSHAHLLAARKMERLLWGASASAAQLRLVTMGEKGMGQKFAMS